MCLTDFNYDSDSTLVRYVGVERQWTDYDVLAVLEAVPYFEELGDDLGEGRTAYGKSSSSGSGSGKSHGLNTTVLVGYEVEVENSGAVLRPPSKTTSPGPPMSAAPLNTASTMKTIPERTQWWCTVFPYWSIPTKIFPTAKI